MTKKSGTKRSLLMSVMALVLCFSMLIGTTFAWFTDSVTSNNNIIKSGTLDVEMLWKDVNETNYKDASTGAIFNNDLWEPGYVDAKHIQIKNVGNLAFKYKLNIVANGDVSKLAEVIDVYYLPTATQVTRDSIAAATPVGTLAQMITDPDGAAYGELYPVNNTMNQDSEKTVTIALKMRESADNKYQDLSIGSDFSVQLLATQLTYESDSFDDLYDQNAGYAVEVNSADALADALRGGGLVKLTDDIAVSKSMTIPAGVTVNLDLNGKTLTFTKGERKEFTTYNGGTGYETAGIFVNEGATLTINGEGATIKHTYGYSDCIFNLGTLNVNGGTYTYESADAYPSGKLLYNYNGATANINGGNFTSNAQYVGVIQNGYAYDAESAAKMTISGNTSVNSLTNWFASVDNCGVLTIKDGTYYDGINNSSTGSTTSITGGTFYTNPSAYVADGYEVTDNGGTWTVNSTFVNISNADGMNDNWDQNILITDDFTVTSENRASANYGLWAYSGIDGNGNTITDNSGAAYAGIYSEGTFIKNLTLNTNSLFGIFASAKTEPLVVNNFTINKSSNGAAFYVQNAPAGITLNDSTITASGVANNAGTANAVVFSTTNSKITINSGTYTATDANGYVVASFYSGSTVTINGGTFNGDLYPVDGGNIVINGGTFNGGFNVLGGNLVINGGTFDADPSTYVNTTTHTVTDNGNGTWTVA